MTYCDGTTWISMSGGASINVGGTTNVPGGSTNQIQYNNGGAFAGDANFTYSGGLVTVTGTVTATNVYASSVSGTTGTFGSLTVGGVAITGSGGAGDRISTTGIASGANLGMVVADKGTISFTTGGVAQTAYIDTSGRFVMPGISVTTAQTSVTTLYASGNVGIGTATPNAKPDVVGIISASTVTATNVAQVNGFFTPVNITSLVGGGGDRILSGTTNVSTFSAGGIKFNSGGATAMIVSGSNVGIGTTSPNATLEVNGTISATTYANAIPSGLIAAFASASCPSGWSEYTAARGRFLRGIDNGAGLDPAGTRAPGATQADAFQGHNHNMPQSANGGLTASSTGGGYLAWYTYSGTTSTGSPTSDGSNGTPCIAAETRPVNVAVLFCSKN